MNEGAELMVVERVRVAGKDEDADEAVVVNEMGPPTSIGESIRVVVGL